MTTSSRRAGRLDDPVWSEGANETHPSGLPSRSKAGKTHRILATVLLTVAFACLWLGSAALISATLVRTYEVPGAGMSPTVTPGTTVSALLLDTTANRGAIVIFHPPPQVRGIGMVPPALIKRVVAIGGDTVACCQRGHLVLDGRSVAEPDASGLQPPFGPVRVPVGKMFVLGDNRSDSQDSKAWGAISTDLVVGRVIAQGAAARVLTPSVLGGAFALLVTFLAWLLGVRRTSAWRGA